MMAYSVPMRAWTLGLGLFAIAACNHGVPYAGGVNDAGPNPCSAQPSGITCFGTEADHCDGAGNTTARTDCAASGQICAPDVGCRVCVPNLTTCDGETVRTCNAQGTASTTGATCNPDAGEHCSPTGCVNLCQQAVTEHSYIGCDYRPTVLPNSGLNPHFAYAVVVANPQLVEAEVTIFASTDVIAQLVIPPGQLAVQELPWVDVLRGDDAHPASVLAVDSAYHLVSDVPVTVTQFNPLRYQIDPSCVSTRYEDGCFSYTNDASLLLPTHVLTGSYLMMSRPSHILVSPDGRDFSPGYMAVVNAEDHMIDVTIHSTAFTIASADGTIPPLAPGESHDFTLGVGDVLVLETRDPGDPCPGETFTDDNGSTSVTYCNPGAQWDLTGTEVSTTERVAVFGGHNCTFVPYNRWACDHLEQQIFPVESLGAQLFVPVTHALRMGEPNLLRIVAARDVADITFDPPLDDGTESIELARGEYTEHEIRHDTWVRSSSLEGDSAILGAIFLVGQNYLGFDTIGASPFAVGDPAMALLVPTVQYRTSYEFLAPDTYSQSYIGVAVPMGGQVYLDEAPITAMLTTSGTTMRPMMTGQLRITTGPHSIRGDQAFGLYVYGFGSYTSYMYPGGLDFRAVGPPL